MNPSETAGKPAEMPGACRIGDRVFRWGERTYVMGIINVTPDSFSGDGLLAEADASQSDRVSLAVQQARRFARAGADVLDVGGESTRPGADLVGIAEEKARVLPVIEALSAQVDLPISVDTYKAEVAAAALEAGADLINDVWGLLADPDVAAVAVQYDVPIVIMHNRSKRSQAVQRQGLGGRYVGVEYDDVVQDVLRTLEAQVALALEAGIARERIIVDPGLGFGKTVAQSLTLIAENARLRRLGLPILLGPSRKSFVGYTLDLPPDQRVEGTMAAIAVAIARGGVDIVRVHDVEAAVRTARMADAIMRPAPAVDGAAAD